MHTQLFCTNKAVHKIYFYKIKSDNSGYTNNDTGNIENAKRIVEINSFQNSSDCYL